ncbi:trypsin-like peptidase domain-containing protein [Caenimonas sedimenti]|uniref:Serine protease n=1 Tax=Caenimonas sedimenti TaxID=2596921 RepID=A0A562ZFH4_9BURK|nr:serine protease [Caenimonas sedimenti]TWO66020.1 trypsin-like peptidase domain-containing protein [Caenimonas sedimenti]
MNPRIAEDVAARLKEGHYDDPPEHVLSAAVQQMADQFATGDKPTDAQMRAAMGALRRHRQFSFMERVGTEWQRAGGKDPLVQRQFAQALVEIGRFDDAGKLVDEALAQADTTDDLALKRELGDYRALRGRIFKQKFVLHEDPNDLARSVEAYQQHYRVRQDYFNGVNVLALRMRLDVMGGDTDPQPLGQLAHNVLKEAEHGALTQPVEPFSRAAASEACLALDLIEPNAGWCDKAELWLCRFLQHSGTGRFEVESFYRQVREIWRGNPLDIGTCAGRLAAMFERHVLRTEHRWSPDARQIARLQRNPGELEKNFGFEKTFTVHHLRRMLDLSPNIGCVTDHDKVRHGTGFLMPGAILNYPEYPLVFVTNAHVISDTVEGALGGAEALVMFEIEHRVVGNTQYHGIEKILFTSDPGEIACVPDAPDLLDVTICALKSLPDGLPGLPAAANIPLVTGKTKAFVVGHPKGGSLQFSLQDSVLLDVCSEQRLMHYRTPTDPGSSGSPVFNENWEVIALHHAGAHDCPRLRGGGSYEANEGITLQAIRRARGVAV